MCIKQCVSYVHHIVLWPQYALVIVVIVHRVLNTSFSQWSRWRDRTTTKEKLVHNAYNVQLSADKNRLQQHSINIIWTTHQQIQAKDRFRTELDKETSKSFFSCCFFPQKKKDNGLMDMNRYIFLILRIVRCDKTITKTQKKTNRRWIKGNCYR